MLQCCTSTEPSPQPAWLRSSRPADVVPGHPETTPPTAISQRHCRLSPRVGESRRPKAQTPSGGFWAGPSPAPKCGRAAEIPDPHGSLAPARRGGTRRRRAAGSVLGRGDKHRATRSSSCASFCNPSFTVPVVLMKMFVTSVCEQTLTALQSQQLFRRSAPGVSGMTSNDPNSSRSCAIAPRTARIAPLSGQILAC